MSVNVQKELYKGVIPPPGTPLSSPSLLNFLKGYFSTHFLPATVFRFIFHIKFDKNNKNQFFKTFLFENLMNP